MPRKLKAAIARPALTDFEPRELVIDFKGKTARMLFDVSTEDGKVTERYEVSISNGMVTGSGPGVLGAKSQADYPPTSVPEGQTPPAPTPTRTAFDALVGPNGVIKPKLLRDIEDLIDTLGMMPG